MTPLGVGAVALLVAATAGACRTAQLPAEPAPSAIIGEIAADAERARGLFAGDDFVQRFLDQAKDLAPRATRRVLIDDVERDVDETDYYVARWGTPVAYARILDLAATAGAKTDAHAHWLDFGFGAPGHLQMLSRMGLDVVGVDIDPIGAAIYTLAEDTIAPPGSISLVYGRWPGTLVTKAKVAAGYDVILSKNVLKRGYIHPAREADPKRLIDLGVDDLTFLKALHDALEPGGLMVIWNLCPAQAAPDEPYIPWADGQNPFSRADWEAAGFELLAFDVDDTAFARKMAYALRFDAPDAPEGRGWDLENDLRAWYSVARRR